MRAYIFSSLDGLVLLRGLEDQAGRLTGYSATSNPASARTSREMPSLRVLKSVDGQATCITISPHNARTLVALLENAEGLINGTAKSRLAALLIPLVTEYVGSRSSDFARADPIRIAFGETTGNGRHGKKCVLFAEDAANHSLCNGKSTAAHRRPEPSTSQTKVVAGAQSQLV